MPYKDPAKKRGWIHTPNGRASTARYNRERRETVQELVLTAKISAECHRCGEKDPRVLQFDDGVADISVRVGLSELKTILGSHPRATCFNCARRIPPSTHSVRGKLQRIKAGRGCLHCGERDGQCLDFHHRDPESKVAEVSKLARMGIGPALIEAEKCDVLCANCHAKHHRPEVRMAA